MCPPCLCDMLRPVLWVFRSGYMRRLERDARHVGMDIWNTPEPYVRVHSRVDCVIRGHIRHAAKTQVGKEMPCQAESSLARSSVAHGHGCRNILSVLFPRQMRGNNLSPFHPARGPVLALHPKWCPTISLRLTLHYASRGGPTEDKRGKQEG